MFSGCVEPENPPGGAASRLKEVHMQRSDFDFDVVFGSSMPPPKPQPAPPSGQTPTPPCPR
jgi:hypothetical protein